MCVDVVIVVVVKYWSYHCCPHVLPSPLPLFPSLSLSLSGPPPGSVNALTPPGDKANVEKSQRDTEREQEGEWEEKEEGRGMREENNMCVCVCVRQHVCGIRVERSEHVLARGEKLLIQLVIAKALSPLSSSLCIPLCLSQNPCLTQSPSLHFTLIYYKQDILLNPKSLPLLLRFFVRSSL